MGDGNNDNTFVSLLYVEERFNNTETRITSVIKEMKEDLKNDLTEIKKQNFVASTKIADINLKQETCEIKNLLTNVKNMKEDLIEVEKTISVLTFLRDNPKLSKFLFIFIVTLLSLNGIKNVFELFTNFKI